MTNSLDWKQLEERIAGGHDRGYWQSLRELAGQEEVEQRRAKEFPDHAGGAGVQPTRRRFLQLLGASLALAGTQGCRQPEEKILPYVEMPEDRIPGKPLYFATALPHHGVGRGVVVESHEGRPTKIEGNRQHAASLGATDSLMQAEILTLYDPDRSQVVLHNGVIASREKFETFLRGLIARLRSDGGRGVHLLSETVTSPTLLRQIEQLQAEMPELQWHSYEPVMRAGAIGGAQLALGENVDTLYDFSRVDCVLSLGADFLNPQLYPPAYSRHFMQRRRVVGSDSTEMSRLYAVESTPGLTGSKADHRWRLAPADMVRFARALAQRFDIDVGDRNATVSPPLSAALVDIVADDLRNYRLADGAGHGLVIAGEEQPAEVQALAHAINQKLQNGGEGGAVKYIAPVAPGQNVPLESMANLTKAMRAGEVELLIVLDGNPVFNAPAELDFAAALKKVPQTVHVGLYVDETAAQAQWHLPGVHALEAWSDLRAFNGEASIVQPLIAPLYNGVSTHELLALLAKGESSSEAYDLVRATWNEQLGESFAESWDQALREGVIKGTAAEPISVEVDFTAIAQYDAPAARGTGLQVIFRADPTIDDGRYANNAWLQELPKPFTKLTWDNAALISPASAEANGLTNGDMVRLTHEKRSVSVPVWILPGQTDDLLTLHFGYGRTRAGKVGNGTGFDVFPLRTSAGMWSLSDVQLTKVGKSYPLADTQEHHLMEGRHPVEHGEHAEWVGHQEHPPFMHHVHHSTDATLYDPEQWKYDGYKWGMAIDLTSCSGCNACVTACQSENNIPVVGKDQVAMGREMHWLRIDSYYHGDMHEPELFHQPVACMHCETAPCEVVCPVAATTHSEEGLNEMTYNRCVGTRYCANNCPYKVRRFNYLQYSEQETPLLQLLHNPNVTVRSRGVMEKCTYCVQRINHARIEADCEDRTIGANEVTTACQSACPTQAIQFGNLNNPGDVVNQRKQSGLDYGLLDDQGTRPRTSYQAQLFNPNPRIHDRN